MRQQQPGRPADRAGQVRHRGIDRDHQVQQRNQCRGIGEIAEQRRVIGQVRQAVQHLLVTAAHVVLDHVQLAFRAVQDAGKIRQRNGSLEVVAVIRIAGPDDADPHAPPWPQSSAPAGQPLARHRQIGDLRRNGFELGAKRQREAHQRGMQIERRQFLAQLAQLRHAGNRGVQRDQRAMDLQHHPGAEGRDHRHVAQEPDRIAVALLGVQQDGLSGDVRLAVPWPLLEAAPGQHARRGDDAGFILLPAGGEIAFPQRDERPGHALPGDLRVELHRPQAGFPPLRPASQRRQRQAQIVVRARLRAIQFDRRSQQFLGLDELAPLVGLLGPLEQQIGEVGHASSARATAASTPSQSPGAG